jgi:dolichyl-phosphate beta-glucosyltransferase
MPCPLTVIIPCYNESSRLAPLFDLIAENVALNWEWLLVDDGSTDDTAARMATFAAAHDDYVRVVAYSSNAGKGNAVRQGLLAATGSLVGYIDADLAASPLDFKAFLDDPDVRGGKAIVAGKRVVAADVVVKRLFYRHVMGRTFQFYTRVLTGVTIYDTQCGFKLLAADKAREIATHMTCKGFAFDVEFLMLAQELGMTIREEGISWEEMGDTSIRVHHIFQMALDILKFRGRIRRFRKQHVLPD